MTIYHKLSKNLKYFRFLVLLFSFFAFIVFAKNSIQINNNEINCLENNCKVKLKNNQKLKLNDDQRIINVIESYKNENEEKEKITNFIFYTTDITNESSFSGKPLEFLISLNTTGVIENLKLIKHSEPILLSGIPVEKLLEATAFYKNKNIKEKINIGENTNEVGIPIIAGATVTSLVLHQTILNSSREVGKICGIIDKSIGEGGLNQNFKNLTWKELLKIKAIKRYQLDSSFNENDKADKNNLLIDIYFADLKHPSIGKNLLGDSEYNELIKELGTEKSAIIILNNGNWSFKGSGFVRGGIFDRFQITQDANTFIFKDTDYKSSIYELNLIDIDDFKEKGIFVVSNKQYKPYKEWNLTLLLNYKYYNIEYKIPSEFCIEEISKTAPKFSYFYLYLYLFLWLFTIIIFIFRYKIAQNSFYLSAVYNFVLIMDVYVIGILLKTQPSVVDILAVLSGKEIISFFKFDPYISLGWIMIIATIFIWGKSLFCGWVCPFGATQELFFKIKSLILRNDSSLEFSNKVISKLKYLRYIIFIVLVITTLSLNKISILIGIEPFKTMWASRILDAGFISIIYTVLLLIISIFTYRFFCRFICPLGAFLSMLSFFTIFKLKRRGTCSACNICKISCNSKAINKSGEIDSKECFGCFTCVNNMYNKNLCPPIKNEKIRKKYEKDWWY